MGQTIDAKLRINQTFRDGLKCKAVYIQCFTSKTLLSFKIGYWLWGMDIWINNVPVMKTIIIANIVVWLLLFWR